MSLLTKIATAKTNVVGTALIAAGSSALTVLLVSGFSGSDDQHQSTATLPLPATASVLECGAKVYSPVQKRCVSQEIFDGEMKRLFAALGIDASIYGAEKETN